MKRALLLRRGVLALERIADALEYALGTQHAAQPDERDIERFDGMTEVQEELAAAIEILEEEGYTVPPESYRALGLDPKRAADREPDERELAAERPDELTPDDPPEPPEPPDPDEPVTARRRT